MMQTWKLCKTFVPTKVTTELIKIEVVKVARWRNLKKKNLHIIQTFASKTGETGTIFMMLTQSD